MVWRSESEVFSPAIRIQGVEPTCQNPKGSAEVRIREGLAQGSEPEGVQSTGQNQRAQFGGQNPRVSVWRLELKRLQWSESNGPEVRM